jgi:hypothetical protein
MNPVHSFDSPGQKFLLRFATMSMMLKLNVIPCVLLSVHLFRCGSWQRLSVEAMTLLIGGQMCNSSAMEMQFFEILRIFFFLGICTNSVST